MSWTTRLMPRTVRKDTTHGDLPHRGPPYPFDHTSVIATVRNCFRLGGPLTSRDAVAPDLEPVLNLDQPTNDGPATVTALSYSVSPAELQAAIEAPLNSFQKAMHEAAAHLPAIGLAADIEAVASNHSGDSAHHPTPADVLPFIKEKLRKIFGA